MLAALINISGAQLCATGQTPFSGAGFANGQPTQAYYQQQLQNSWTNNFPIALVAVLVAFAIATIIFMIGAASKNDTLRNFGIGEIYEAVSTAIIVGMFIIIATIALNLNISFLGASSTAPQSNPALVANAATDPYYYAFNGICTTITDVQGVYDSLLNGGTYQVDYQGQYFTAGGSAPTQATGYKGVMELLSISLSVTYMGLPLLNQIVAVVSDTRSISLNSQVIVPSIAVASFLIDALYLLWSEYYLIFFFSIVGPIFVAVGAIFRAILPTRAFGGMLIALGIGLFIVLPSILAFMYTLNPSPCAVGLCPYQTQWYSGIPFNNIVQGFLNRLWLIILFYPLMAIALTYAFVTQLGNFIGASSQMGGRIRTGFI